MSIKKGTVVPFFNIPKKQKNLSLDPSASSGQVPRGKNAMRLGEFEKQTRRHDTLVGTLPFTQGRSTSRLPKNRLPQIH